MSPDQPACIVRQNQNYRSNSPQYEGVSIPPPISKWYKSTLTYAIGRESKDIPERTAEVYGLNLAIETWKVEINLNFKKVKITDSPDITISFKDPLSDPFMKDDPTNIMGYAGYPGTNLQGVLVLNDSMNWNWDGSMFRYKFMNTFIHELGHIIGLQHTPECITCIMYPIYNGNVDLGIDDIAQAVANYGKRTAFSNYYLRIKNWLKIRKSEPF